MEIKIRLPSDKRIKVVEYVPEGNALKLVGLNGIGKTICAKLLCTIAGYPVWNSQDQLDKLSKYLSFFEVDINIGDKNKTRFLVRSDITKWNFDSIKKIVIDETIGEIRKNDSESNINELRNFFNCYLVMGTEEISKQIQFIAKSFVIQINKFLQENDRYLDKFFTYSSNIRKFLSNDDKLDLLMLKRNNLEEEMKYECKLNKDDTNFFFKIIELLKDTNIELLPNFDEFKEKIQTQISNLDSELKNMEGKISIIQNNLTKVSKEEIIKVNNSLKQIDEEISKQNPPLNIKDFPDEKHIRDRQSFLSKERKRILEARKIVLSHRFRGTVWDNAEHAILSGLETYDLDEKTILLFGRDYEDDVTSEELRNWISYTMNEGNEELLKSPEFIELQDQLKKIKEEESNLVKHRNFLKAWNKLIFQREQIKKQIEGMENADTQVKNLSNLTEKKKNIETKLSKLRIIDENLKDTSTTSVEFWNSFFKKRGFEFDQLMDVISSHQYHYNKLENLEKEKNIIEKGYLSHIKNNLNKYRNKLPSIITHAIEGNDYEFIYKCQKILINLIDGPKLNSFKNEINKTVDAILKSTEQSGSDITVDDQYCNKINSKVGEKLKSFLNQEAFKKYVFDGADVIEVDALNGIINLKINEEHLSKFILDYSSGEKAFAYAFSTILNIFASEKIEDRNDILFLDEFGALLSADRMAFLLSKLNELQTQYKWPNKIVLISPYKDEFTLQSQLYGDKAKEYSNSIKKSGYVYYPLEV